MVADLVLIALGIALQPFRQVDGSLSRRYEGTGLGLPLARTFTELHGGRLEVASAKGHGTTVTVRIPAVAAVQSGAAIAPLPLRERVPERSGGG